MTRTYHVTLPDGSTATLTFPWRDLTDPAVQAAVCRLFVEAAARDLDELLRAGRFDPQDVALLGMKENCGLVLRVAPLEVVLPPRRPAKNYRHGRGRVNVKSTPTLRGLPDVGAIAAGE